MAVLNVFAISVLGLLVGFTAPLVVGFCVLFGVPIPGWYKTPDNPDYGDVAEPAVRRWLDKYGTKVSTFLWLGLRNRAHGFMFQWAKPFPHGPWSPWKTGTLSLSEFDSEAGIWYKRSIILKFWVFKRGWRSYHVGDKWYGVPCWTFTKP